MKQVLITGGNGYLGFRIARRLLETTRDSVNLWLRAGGREEFAQERQALAGRLSRFSDRVTYSWGDLTEGRPFRRVDPREIDSIIHAACVTWPGVDREKARKVNIEGTHKLLKFADGCQALQSLGMLGSLYSSGLRSGVIKEQPLDSNAGFGNNYEWSAWRSESLLLGRFNHLPWRIFRLAAVISDDDYGNVIRLNALHNMLKLVYYGFMSLVPGEPETAVYLVTGDLVADAVATLMHSPDNRVIYHVSPDRQEAITLGEVVDLAFDTFSYEEDFRSRRVLRPLMCDQETFTLLTEGLNGRRSGILSEAFATVVPFSGQLYTDKDVRHHNLVASFSGYHPPDARKLVQETCAFLSRTNWQQNVYGRLVTNS